ncbi:hypothetical protein FPZ12_031685 [Amycolatopsis acidicola]|uniref:Uncharacterized protein n=1 Tax=Amycolatopsis acidicola TaxID=2596893 RepID=A0A5N0UTR2_9PSEU|nr:hypothetical protein [Amycolatopsis acidicola]KAA9154588.1 hypothetical protein FPZ12_031685 [Amycolatopsis acidicola]
MRFGRILLVLPGLAALAWGIVLLSQLAFRQQLVTGGWLLGGPIVHDLLIAPFVGLLVSHVVSVRWRVPLLTGLAVSGVLVLLAVPLLWRTFGTPPSPGLHDGHPLVGLLVALAVVWVLVLGAGLVRRVRRR